MRALIALLLPFAAWGLSAQSTTIRDSAGIQIVENVARRTAPVAFTVAAQPKLTLTGTRASGDSQFLSGHRAPVRMLQLRNGSLVVANGILPMAATDSALVRLTYYAANGNFLRNTIVGGGFRSIWELCQGKGDTVIIADVNSQRIGVVDGAGKLVHVVAIDGGSIPEMCFGDGTIRISNGRRKLGDEYQQHIFSVHTDGTVVHDFGWLTITSNLGLASIPASGDYLYVADRRGNEYRMYRANGTLARIVRTRDPIDSITLSDIAAGKVLSPITGRALPPGQNSSEVWASYGRAKSDPQGRLWVTDAERDGTISRNWTAFGADGKLIGRVEIPKPPTNESWVVDQFVGDQVIIQSTDRNTGEVKLRVMTLQPAAAPRPIVPFLWQRSEGERLTTPILARRSSVPTEGRHFG